MENVLDKEIEVSVCIITYNHESYIEKCIESVVSQSTSFNFEIIVGDDCSTDRTREILNSLSEKYQNKLKLIFQTENINGGCNNFLKTHEAARGVYVAHLDGDDWMLPGKLQKQYDMLNSNKNISACWHHLERYDEGGSYLPESYMPSKIKPSLIKYKDILSFGSIGGASSLMYRRRLYPSSMKSIFYDFDFSLEILRHSDGLFICEYLGGYRQSSISSITSKHIISNENTQRAIQLKSYENYIVTNSLSKFYLGVFSVYSIFAAVRHREKTKWIFFAKLIHLVNIKLVTELPILVMLRLKIYMN